jgi:hypothetical protein
MPISYDPTEGDFRRDKLGAAEDTGEFACSLMMASRAKES